MAENPNEGQDKTEEPTEERRQEFREEGDVAQSREFTNTLALVVGTFFLSMTAFQFFKQIRKYFTFSFSNLEHFRKNNPLDTLTEGSLTFLYLVIPLSLAIAVSWVLGTLLQTRFNFSFKKINFHWHMLNPLSGLKRIFSTQAFVELLKSILKMFFIALVGYLVLHSERKNVPGLLYWHLEHTLTYWASISRLLTYAVASFLLLVAGMDFFYHFTTIENRMKMSKQEIKEDYKKREVDPAIKGRMRKMQRDLIFRKSIKDTKNATVIITNPTHYAVAIKYDLGMSSPKLIAKGVDFMALQMREIAKEHDIPIVENKPLARTIYATMNIGDDIPQSLYQAMSEVIRYVFKLKGVQITKNQSTGIKNKAKQPEEIR